MTDTVDSIYEIINRSKYPNDVTDLYIHNPIIGKVSCWEPLGNKLSANEKIAIANIPSEKYFTIRLDGKNFSSVVPVLVRLGLFSSGYSIEFENIMKLIADKLAVKFQNVLFVFTQSDEIAIIIDKIKLSPDGSVFPREYSGRNDKLVSLSSSYASVLFFSELVKINNKKGLNLNIDDIPPTIFDARIGVYDTLDDAFELILWRAYDCSVNGLSQAVHNCKIPNSKQARLYNTGDKLKFLETNGLLPLRDHQAYGTLLARTYTETECVNQMTGKTTTKNMRSYVQINGPVIKNIKEDVGDIFV